MPDLTSVYLGLKLKNPLIVSSCDLTKSLSGIKKCEDAGAGAVVLKSIFEEQFLIHSDISESEYFIHPEATDYLRSGHLLEYAPHALTEMITAAKDATDIPIIASINCQTPHLWPRFSRQIEQAGADALELNVYILPIRIDESSNYIDEYHIKILQEIKKTVSIPVSIKLMSNISAVPYLAYKLCDEGCDGLVLFNWFLEPDIDTEKLVTKSRIGKGNFYYTLRWVALTSERVGCDIAASGGIQSAQDVIKQILAGASAVQACSIFYKKGLSEINNILEGLAIWMEAHKFNSINDFKGELSFKKQELSFRNLGEAEAYFRAQYLKTYSNLNYS